MLCYLHKLSDNEMHDFIKVQEISKFMCVYKEIE